MLTDLTISDTNKLLLEEAPGGVFIADAQGNVVLANAYFRQVLALTEADLSKLHISQLLSTTGSIFFDSHIIPQVKLHQKANEIYLNLQTKTKKKLPVVLNAVATRLNNEAAIICTFMPVKQRRKYEEQTTLARSKVEEAIAKNRALKHSAVQLQQQQAELETQVAGFSKQNKELISLVNVVMQDLQEPVRKLIIYGNELEDDALTLERKKAAITVFKKSAQRIKNLLMNTQDYLNLSHPVRSHEQIKLDEVVRYELMQLQKTHPKVKVSATIDALPAIKCDSNQIHWMFYHILKNGFDHGTRDNNLQLQIISAVVQDNIPGILHGQDRFGDFVKIEITDKGNGFDPQFNEYVLEVLKRLNTETENLGFGLAYCKRIAENHAGRISCNGQPGVGATVSVMFPMEKAV